MEDKEAGQKKNLTAETIRFYGRMLALLLLVIGGVIFFVLTANGTLSLEQALPIISFSFFAATMAIVTSNEVARNIEKKMEQIPGLH